MCVNKLIKCLQVSGNGGRIEQDRGDKIINKQNIRAFWMK